MKPVQVGNHFAIARKWQSALTCVEIYATSEDREPAVGVYELHSGRISIALFDTDVTDIVVAQARSLASLLEAAAAIASDWDSWKEGDRDA